MSKAPRREDKGDGGINHFNEVLKGMPVSVRTSEGFMIDEVVEGLLGPFVVISGATLEGDGEVSNTCILLLRASSIICISPSPKEGREGRGRHRREGGDRNAHSDGGEDFEG